MTNMGMVRWGRERWNFLSRERLCPDIGCLITVTSISPKL
jgi:hypothetical protein